VKSSSLAARVAELTLTKKASDVVIMDLRKLSPVTDYFVICSADSDVQARAIADAVEDGMDAAGERVWHRENGAGTWVILDYVDVVVHIFHRTMRAFYNLEKLWGDAAITAVEEPSRAPAAATPAARMKPATAATRAPKAAGRKKPGAKRGARTVPGKSAAKPKARPRKAQTKK
jgi:ribosome-associated protein